MTSRAAGRRFLIGRPVKAPGPADDTAMTSPAPQPAPPVDTRDAILNAAEELFAEQGFAATPISAIATRAGVTKSLVHHYFGSKEALYEAVQETRFAEYHAVQSALLTNGAPCLELFRDSARAYFLFLKRNPRLVRLKDWCNLEGREFMQGSGKDLITAGVEVIRHGQAAGVIRADLDARFVLGAFFSLLRNWFSDCGMVKALLGHETTDVDDEAYLETATTMLLDSLRPR